MLSYRFWLAAGLFSLIILLYSQLELVWPSWETYSRIGKNNGQKTSVGDEFATSSSVVAVQKTEHITLTSVVQPSNPTETPTAPTPLDKIIVAGKLATENTTWIGEDLSESVLPSLVILLNSY